MGNNKWRFQDIPYERPDFNEIQNLLEVLANEVREADAYEKVYNAIINYNKIQEELETVAGLLYARSFHDMTDNFYQTEFQEVMSALPRLNTESVHEALLLSKFGEQIDETFGKQYRNILRINTQLNKNAKDLQAKEQELVARYQQKKATMKYYVNGEEVSEGKLHELVTSKERQIRKAAFEGENDGILKEKAEFTEILRELVKTRNRIAKENGFENYMEYANLSHRRINYGDKEILKFVNEIKCYIVPLYLQLQEEQRKRLGVEVLMPYDTPLVFPESNVRPIGGEQALAEAAEEMYASLSKDAGAFFKEMQKRELLDVASSDKKISGMGFCTDLAGEWRMPFVFANFNGTANDVSVYTHELGHGYQGWRAFQKQKLAVYYSGGPDLAEIPSKTMELFAYPYANLFFGEGAEQFRQEHSYGIVKELCAYCQRYEFESWLYQHEDDTLEQWALKNDEIAKSFGRSLNNDMYKDKVVEGANLFTDMAIYMFPFYVVSYALSEICALEFKSRAKENWEDTWESYNRLCEAGGSLDYKETLKLADLALPYEQDAVIKIVHTLKEMCHIDD